ncbi:ABC transporter permease [Frankia sp. CNm7]|uniref:ABC transporter permease n=1 Tax=Frankia nepalensis TaxID=1836974 RepID=A0A937RGE7_9ACTN|nr:ABC transporter permease [Frankia nepalensis]MBL7494785.1 ABC transporter permease [Frankia nepalensis]MBL7514341.1 ABC transporter permease [Frankia nepalensis]MBL7517242.1 ABC transporter permease [Frankia nepalensis]MBL7631731.1 ABC transporter permease [Frankia nepalensis]
MTEATIPAQFSPPDAATAAPPPASGAPGAPGAPGSPAAPAAESRLAGIGRGLGRWAAALGAALVVFTVLLLAKGANPFTVYADVWTSTFTNTPSIEQIFVKAAPLLLGALAVVVPARAGLVNVGGEGQIVIGAVAAGGIALAFDDKLGGGLVVVLMVVAAMAAGAAWAGLAALLRLTVGINEAVSTLLMNYIALDILLYLIYSPWKDPDGTGQPTSAELADPAKLPYLGMSAVHVGFVFALIATAVVFVLLRYTTWGFRLRVIGGNPEAARRAGLPVALLLLSAMLVGGALAGLAGMVHFAGVEYKLRTGITTNFGYIAFLASWLARHNPLSVVVAALALAAITVAGDSLQLDAGLPAATVNILMGLVLIAVLGWTARRKSGGNAR